MLELAALVEILIQLGPVLRAQAIQDIMQEAEVVGHIHKRLHRQRGELVVAGHLQFVLLERHRMALLERLILVVAVVATVMVGLLALAAQEL